jgi:hypothetical protein
MLLLRGCYSGRPCHFSDMGLVRLIVLFAFWTTLNAFFLVRLRTSLSFFLLLREEGWVCLRAGPRSGSGMLGFHLIGLRETGSITGPFGYFLFCLVFVVLIFCFRKERLLPRLWASNAWISKFSGRRFLVRSL